MQPQSFLLISFSLASLTLTFLFNTGKANHLSWGSPWFSLSYSGNRSVISRKYLSLKEGGVRCGEQAFEAEGGVSRAVRVECVRYIWEENQITSLDHEVHEREIWNTRLEKLVEARTWRTLNLRGKGLFWCSFGIHWVFGIEHSDITESVWGRISLVDEL